MAKTKNKNKKPHVVLGLVLIILLVPTILLGAIVYSTLEDSSKPVIGQRYENELDPAITEENIKSLENILTVDNSEKIEINFKSARVAVLVDMKDDASSDAIKNAVTTAFKKVNEVLPIDTYFTNRVDGETTTKMYDLQIDAYNVVSGENQIHYVLTKTGASEDEIIQLVSSPKDKDVANEVLSQGEEKGE